VEELLRELAKDSGLATYGIEEVRRAAELAGLPTPRLLVEEGDGGKVIDYLKSAESRGFAGIGLRCLDRPCYVAVPGQKMLGELALRLLARGDYAEAAAIVLAAAVRAVLLGYSVPRTISSLYDAVQPIVQALYERARGGRPGVRVSAWLSEPGPELGEALATALRSYGELVSAELVAERNGSVRLEAVAGGVEEPVKAMEALESLVARALALAVLGYPATRFEGPPASS
jgi:hypothetical protein